MGDLIVVIGYGATGRATAARLLERGSDVRVVQRTRPADLPERAQFVACDVFDAASVERAVAGAAQVVLAIGFPYDAKIWKTAWPATMTNVLHACEENGARLVFIDNLYQLGPQMEPRREDMPLSDRGRKPAILAGITRQWQAAAAAGRVRVASLRCPDFYGPNVPMSYLGATSFGQLAIGKPAQVVSPDMPHDFAYVPDIARAVASLLDAPDDAFNQIWNVPCAPTKTLRKVIVIGANATNLKARYLELPLWLLPAIGLFVPFMSEVADVSFTWDRPYIVDATKFTQRFWSDVTPFEIGAAETARSFIRA